MEPISYDFDEKLKMSEGYSERSDIAFILIENIPAAVSVHKAHTQNDRNGTDYWVEMKTGKLLSVDCKVREEDWAQMGHDDLALESWSVVEKGVVGWTRDSKKQTDFVLWLWKDTGRWCLIPFQYLCHIYEKNWESWKEKYKTARQKTPRANYSYHSECTFVPRRVVWEAIYRVYA